MSASADVVVVGGGPAGCATAIALRRLGVERVAVVEAASQGGRAVRLGESIPPDSRVLLERLGVWERFAADGHEPCFGSCSAWGSGELGYNDFLFNPHGHGWHLDRPRFDALLAEVARAGGVRFSGEPVPAGFVVDATGRTSRVARSRGARQLPHDRLTCVYAFMELPEDSRLTRLTMLEAVEYGWWYAARLPGGSVAVAVASDPSLVKELRLHTVDGWRAGLAATEHLSGELAGCESQDLVARTAPSFVLDRAAGEDWLAVGDAAASCDPISSQGIHNALSDGLRAADAIVGGAMDEYAESIAARFARYLSERDYLYALESRWAGAPFWTRRLTSAAARSPDSIAPSM